MGEPSTRRDRGRLSWLRPGGLVIAGIAFVVTRTFVAEAIDPGTVQYLVTGVLPLLAGLGLTAYGVALAVTGYPKAYVRTVTTWVVLGTLGMLVVLGLSTFDTAMTDSAGRAFGSAPVLAANVLVGGAVGGALIGRRSARNHLHRREIQRQMNRSALVTRILRHEVVNAATIADGYASTIGDGDDERAVSAIRESASRIVDTVEDVGDLTDDRDVVDVQVGAHLDAVVDDVRATHPDVDVVTDGFDDGVVARADDRIRFVLHELVENAIENGASRVEVVAWNAPTATCITVSDDASGLPDAQRRLLEAGAFPEYDDPSTGFGLKVVRLLVARYGGELAVTTGFDDTGTAITVELLHADVDPNDDSVLGVSSGTLRHGTVAGLVAGIAMGGVFLATTDVLPVIGSLYGVQNPVVGWVTHLFHSVVFALALVPGFGYLRRSRSDGDVLAPTLAGVAWGAVLWLVAAGVVMPLWLRAVGIAAPLPNLPEVGLLAHVVWGAVLGAAYGVLQSGRLAPDASDGRPARDGQPDSSE